MELLSRYVKRQEFSSYEDFKENFKIDIPENFNFGFDIVDEWAKYEPEKVALVWCDDDGDKRNFTFSEISSLSNKTANYFKSQGIKKGDRVMVVLKRRYEYWIIAIALHKMGAILIPATAQLKTKDFVYRFQAAGVRAVVCVSDDCTIESIDEAQAECPTLTLKINVNGQKDGWQNFDSAIEKCSDSFSRPEGDEFPRNDDIMLLYFTSGTTGYPKMVCHNFAYPLGHIITAKYWQNVIPGELHLTVAETGWAKSSWGKIYGQWICGAVLFVYDYSEKFKPTDLLEKIQEYKISTFCAPPTILRFLIKADLENYDLSSLRHCSTAGEALNPEVFNKFLKETGQEIHEGFGQTEGVVILGTFPWIEPRPGSLGKPSPSYDVHLLDENDNECEDGEIGHIAIKTDKMMPYGLFCGYYMDEEKTKTVWHDGFYYTGDLAWRDEDGYYWYVGRSDDVIKSSGYRIGPFEVESALMEHPAVLETAITAVPDEIRGQIVKATVVLAPGYEPSEELKKELQNHVKITTAPYKYPRIVDFVDSLPKTASGKIMRAKLREKDSM